MKSANKFIHRPSSVHTEEWQQLNDILARFVEQGSELPEWARADMDWLITTFAEWVDEQDDADADVWFND